ncbi:MAG: hypothetical protein JWR33_1593 [Naasia sp.]|uniref:glycosyltransferase family 39 protein n=1 Tax=Naasia sp. TaxID=2546198 RepID=UPI0026253ACA|nr:glycosyltransferase family 39 protein [Naasia sp.]MCU1570852.1 hypothetical protein [Naasia sp.]
MADRLDSLTRGTAAPVAAESPAPIWWHRVPWWLRITLVYAGARLLTTIVLALTATQLTPQSRAGAHPDFFSYTALWDGYWYWYIAAVGYPSTLPLDVAGHVAENQWAFMPVYPYVVAGLAWMTGAWWPVAAFVVSLACGFAAALLLYRLFRLRLDEDTSFFAVVLFSVSPLSFIFQMAYAESMSTLLLILSLYLMLRRRWVWLFPVVAVMALTRPTGLAFALALGLYWIFRFLTRDKDPFPVRERVLTAGVAVFSGLMGLAWSGIAWIVTGNPSAYTDTELAWRAPVLGYQHLVPFAPWFQAASTWFGTPIGISAVVLVIVAFTALLLTRGVRRLGIELRLWLASYGLYLLAVFFPQSSTFRLLIPMFPLAGVLAQPRSTTYRIGVILLSLVLQFAWLWATWGPVSSYWSVP